MSQPTSECVELSKHIVVDPFLCDGKPTFKGTCKMVHHVLEAFESGLTLEQFAEESQLPHEAIVEALELAAKAFLQQYAVASPEPQPLEEATETFEENRVKNPAYQLLELGKYIAAAPFVCHGQPTFKGSRKMVHRLIAVFASGRTLDELVYQTDLPRQAILEALQLAAKAIVQQFSVPSPRIKHLATDVVPVVVSSSATEYSS